MLALYMLDLAEFVVRHDAFEKLASPLCSNITDCISPFQNRSTSSVKHKWFRCIPLHLEWCANPLSVATLHMILVKYSMQIKNINGDIGSPCRNSLFHSMFSYNPPLIVIEYLGVEMYVIVHLINLLWKFIACSTSSTKSHSTVCWAFLKSILIKQLSVVAFLLYSLTKS